MASEPGVQAAPEGVTREEPRGFGLKGWRDAVQPPKSGFRKPPGKGEGQGGIGFVRFWGFSALRGICKARVGVCGAPENMEA